MVATTFLRVNQIYWHMKKSFLLQILVSGICVCSFAQGDSEPCCNVIGIDAAKGMVTVRDKTSGKLSQFKADAMDLRGIQKGDAVNVSVDKIVSINGAKRTYATLRPDYGEPCCNIVKIEPDAGEPCCNMVTLAQNSSNQTYSIQVPKQIAGTLKKGQAVAMDATSNMAVIQSSYGGQIAAYGYPAESGESASGISSADKWTVKANSALKGASGRLHFDNPSGSKWVLYIYAMADNKYITSYADVNNNGSVVVMPGEYKITINDVPVLNVPIKKGHDTKLKCGVLNVVSQSYWDLSDETGKTMYTSNNGPLKIPVPIGTYTFNLGGQKQVIVIENGKVLER